MLNMESLLIQILVQGGLASVALVSMWLFYKLASNHINHNTEAMRELSETLGELKQVIKDYHKSNGKK